MQKAARAGAWVQMGERGINVYNTSKQALHQMVHLTTSNAIVYLLYYNHMYRP